MQDLRDEAVDVEVRARPGAMREARVQHHVEEVPPPVDHRRDRDQDEAERQQREPREEQVPVRDEQHERADDQAQGARAGKRRELHEQTKGDQHGEPAPPRVRPLEPQVERRQDQERHQERDPEVVRVAGQRVRPVDVRAVDRAVDVDLARAVRQRLQEERVEVVPRLCHQQLQDPVARVADDPAEEPAECPPVEAHRVAGQVDHSDDQEREVEQPLRDPLAELVEGLCRLEVEEAD